MNKLNEVVFSAIFWIAATAVVAYAFKGASGDFPPQWFFGWMGGAWAAFTWSDLDE